MKLRVLLLILSIVVGSTSTISAVTPSASVVPTAAVSPVKDNVNVVTWEMMEALNYETGEMPDSLKALHNHQVEVTGFIVPLEMDEYIDSVKEFLLVPDPLACIHVPPPPPNQLIYVEMNKEIPLDMDYRGVAVTGILFISESNGTFGYKLSGTSAKEANIEFDDPLMDILWFE